MAAVVFVIGRAISAGAGVALILGGTALVLLIANAVRSATVRPDPNPGRAWAESDLGLIWAERAAEYREDFGLEPTRDIASKWSASIAALLGVLSAVAFVAGPSDLVEDVGGKPAEYAAWLILAAAGVAALGLVYAVLAEQGVPAWTCNLDGWAYRSLTQKRAIKSADQIRASRWLIVLALILIILATGIAWMAALTGDKSTDQHAIVVTNSGVTCGVLVAGDDALRIRVGDDATPVAFRAPVTLVGGCP